jgi:Tol biopolymer transport system component
MRRLFCLLLALFVAAGLVTTPVTQAQEPEGDTTLTVGHYLDWEQVSGPRISPDGSQIVYSRSQVNTEEDSWSSEIWIMDADGSKNRFLVEGSSPRWSPDGERIAFVKEG